MPRKLLSVFLLLILTIGVLSFKGHDVKAESDSERKAALEQQIAEYQRQITDLQSKANTLTNQIAQFNAQINLTTLKIEQTQDQITLLSERITQLGSSLESLTSAYNSRVIETYKMSRVGNSPFLVLASGKLSDAISNYQYLKLAQESDQSLLVRLSKAQDGYQNQKQEQQALSDTLAKQKRTLDSQKAARGQLLATTKDSEKKYQQLLSDAKAQLAAFSHFTQGSSILSNQTKCDSWGCYYNQRDSQWAMQTIGSSSETVKDVGCLITSMAMVATHYGKSLKPNDIAGSNAPFFGNTAYMNVGTWSVNGVTMTRTRLGSGTGNIDSELAANRPVVVGIYGGPDHFLVIKKKEGTDYIMNDPFVENGHDIKFTDHYPLSAISSVDRVSVN